jgi:hypothetical protein
VAAGRVESIREGKNEPSDGSKDEAINRSEGVMESDRDEAAAVLAQIRKTRDTADRLANGDYPEDADHTRVLAGMVKQLAEQMERLANLSFPQPAEEASTREAS